ncbi:MAG: hypothetical protein SFY68_10070 [Candidatus Sumerlaeia bacterium]|nr:hypothetical protein [Candidatus Sumerlaeia bacterium]
MTSANQKTLFPAVEEDPLQWLWARHQRKFSQRILQGLIIAILPTFLVSWYLLLGLDSRNIGEFALLYSLAWHFFTVGFLVDQGTDLVRRFKESGMLPDILLTGYSLKDIHASLTTAVKDSIHRLLNWSLGIQVLILLWLQLVKDDGIDWAEATVLRGFTLLLILANFSACRKMSRYLAVRLLQRCLTQQLTVVGLLPALLSTRFLAYGVCFLVSAICFSGLIPYPITIGLLLLWGAAWSLLQPHSSHWEELTELEVGET